ncbi:hypothetical protein [Tenacibaculum sp. SG-28]|uniref:hypothetical protein n=1 Tax=Tenacibaculum sp. SG-28 TaxID=754426 RepID=UPI000CF4617F|nr:hypothetical protein [Tenacibaculum sp. SG-28]PQJ19700.1 hypothetical protein BSU00_12085 [Tenacibaculum sp. SG-28]
MGNNFKELQEHWQKNKSKLTSSTQDLNEVYDTIASKERSNFFFYYGTIATLTCTLLALALFFYFVAPVREIMSRIGAGLMLIGLLVRIGFEIKSIYKAKQIKNIDDTLKTISNTEDFHNFRKKIHQIVAPTILFLYTIGFYMITPEFSNYISFWNLVLIDISYLVIGIVLFIIIRKGVLKEMKILQEIISLKNDIIQEQ